MKTNPDPTKTTILRKTFVSDMTRRFKAIERLSNTSIIYNDCFGLGLEKWFASAYATTDAWKRNLWPIPINEFKFETNVNKVQGFMKWLEEMEASSLLKTQVVPTIGPGVNRHWTNLYIAKAYKKGMLSARVKIKSDKKVTDSLDLNSDDISTDSEDIQKAFRTGMHSDRVGLLYTRSFSDLKGITAEMDTQISRTLADGLLSGSGADVIAKSIANRVKKVGMHRATLLARTEIIRAHHMASIQTYRDYGILGVRVDAEWVTAGDSRVCEICSPLNKKIYTLDEVEGKIPVHPQCRCSSVPVVVE